MELSKLWADTYGLRDGIMALWRNTLVCVQQADLTVFQTLTSPARNLQPFTEEKAELKLMFFQYMSTQARQHGCTLVRLAISVSHSEGTLQSSPGSTRDSAQASLNGIRRWTRVSPHALIPEAGILHILLLAPILSPGANPGKNGLSRSVTRLSERCCSNNVRPDSDSGEH
jgi:hypothetical protein